jgi:hypothetical protein
MWVTKSTLSVVSRLYVSSRIIRMIGPLGVGWGVYVYTDIYICIYIYVHIHIYICTYIEDIHIHGHIYMLYLLI